LLGTPQERQLLSLVDVTVDICRKYSGAVGKMRDVSLLDGPLIQWNDDTTPKAPREEVMKLFDINRKHNSLFDHHLCCLEFDHPTRGVPVLPSSAIEELGRKGRARDPRPPVGADAAGNMECGAGPSSQPTQDEGDDEDSSLQEAIKSSRSLRKAMTAVITVDGVDAKRAAASGANPFLVGMQHLRASGGLTDRRVALQMDVDGMQDDAPAHSALSAPPRVASFRIILGTGMALTMVWGPPRITASAAFALNSPPLRWTLLTYWSRPKRSAASRCWRVCGKAR
jgi:hypothetical protein